MITQYDYMISEIFYSGDNNIVALSIILRELTNFEILYIFIRFSSDWTLHDQKSGLYT